jgi:hypothetical protein
VAKAPDPHAGTKDADKAGLLSGLLAEENEFDRRSLFRIGSWGFAAVGAVVLAVAANQSSMGWRRDQVAATDLTRQAQQIQSVAKESQSEARRLASAIDTLNSDRDRLFARVTVVEQGLDSVTGAISKQSAAASSAAAASSPPKPMPPASAMPSMIAAPPVVAADNSGPSVPLPPTQAAPASNLGAIPLEKPKESKTEQPKTDQPKAEPAKPAPAAAADTALLPQIASNKPPAAPPAASPAPAPPVSAQTPPPAMGAGKSMMGPPDPGAPRLMETSKEPAKEPIKTAANVALVPAPAALAPDASAATAPPKDQEKLELDADTATDADKSTIQRTEFAVELGGANSIGGLRALWRGLLKSRENKTALGDLQPIIVLRESNTGLGMQLKLAAGPLHDAAEAAKICAALTESNKRSCETTVFDGQRLAMGASEETTQPPAPAAAKPQPATEAGGKSTSYKRYRHNSKKDEAPAAASPPPKEGSTFSSLLGLAKR